MQGISTTEPRTLCLVDPPLRWLGLIFFLSDTSGGRWSRLFAGLGL
jgi:hypothetical protein